MKDIRYEKINMDTYFYSICRIKENFRKINNEHAMLYIYTYIGNVKKV